MRSTEESLRLVPQALRNASHALVATQWQTILGVTVPAALPAIITGVFLAIARVAGETAPLLITAYGSNFWPRGPSDRTPFLAKYIYDYSRSGYPDWERQAWAAALVLLAVVMMLNVGIRLATGKPAARPCGIGIEHNRGNAALCQMQRRRQTCQPAANDDNRHRVRGSR